MKTILSTLLAGGLCIVILGGEYSAAVESNVPLSPGKMYEIGGHKMHLYHLGQTNKGTSIILEASASAFQSTDMSFNRSRRSPCRNRIDRKITRLNSSH